MSAGLRIDCYGCARERTSSILLAQCMPVCVKNGQEVALRHKCRDFCGASCHVFLSALLVPNNFLYRERKNSVCDQYYTR